MARRQAAARVAAADSAMGKARRALAPLAPMATRATPPPSHPITPMVAVATAPSVNRAHADHAIRARRNTAAVPAPLAARRAPVVVALAPQATGRVLPAPAPAAVAPAAIPVPPGGHATTVAVAGRDRNADNSSRVEKALADGIAKHGAIRDIGNASC